LLRADLATLLSFAKSLRSDAEAWRAALEAGLEDMARRAVTARQERERLAAEREALVQKRDALQSRIVATADSIVRDTGGEYRRTLPCFTLTDALTVCSLKVSRPRRGFRPEKRWLVTLSDSREEVVVRRAYV
jgi:hypothetical protein